MLEKLHKLDSVWFVTRDCHILIYVNGKRILMMGSQVIFFLISSIYIF